LKIFLTQIRPALPLTLDPPVSLRDDQKGGTTIKIAISGVFPPKLNYFCHPPRIYPRSAPTFGPTSEILLCAYVARKHAAAQATRCPGGGHAARRPCLATAVDDTRADAGRSSHVRLARTAAGTELPWPLRTRVAAGRSSRGRDKSRLRSHGRESARLPRLCPCQSHGRGLLISCFSLG
jgi:hypothetical protein